MATPRSRDRGSSGQFGQELRQARVERLGRCEVDARPFAFVDRQLAVIHLQIVPEQAKAKTILSLKRTVAGATVATEFAYQRDYVPGESGNFVHFGAAESLAQRCKRPGTFVGCLDCDSARQYGCHRYLNRLKEG